MPKISVIIPTFQRPKSLAKCIGSIKLGTFQDFEIIKVRSEGELAELRNRGFKRSSGEIVVFIDDDVVCSEGWLQSIVQIFDFSSNIAGVSGPSIITKRFRQNRDIFRHAWLKRLYDFFFLGKKANLPGHFTESGAWTTGACEELCSYEGEVEFLEACNMAFRRSVFQEVKGFDENYKGIGDWSEPDICFRIRKLGYRLWFTRDAVVHHQPAISGAFKKRRKDSRNRMENYLIFSKRWIKPHWKHELYKLFMRIYYGLKTLKR